MGYGGRSLKKTIKVYTNDGQQPVSNLTVTGEVKKLADVDPSRALLNGEVGERLSVAVKISPVSQGMFEITEAKADKGEEIRLTLTDGDESGKKVYTLVIENTRKTPGRYHDTVRLLTKGRVQQSILIPVWGNIRAPQIASIEPHHVALNGRAGEPIQKSVLIVPRDGQSFSITEVNAQSGQHIKWDLQETVNSGKKTYTLVVENLKKDKGVYYDTLLLRTDNPFLPEVRISVCGRLTE